MSDATYDEFEEDLSFGDLTDYNFLLSEDNVSHHSTDTSLSPCVVSNTPINPVQLPVSPRGLGNDENLVRPKRNRSSSHPRQVYLITYSQADVLKVQSRKKFAEIICNEFNREDNIVENWVVSAELHRKGGFHYHLALKLKKQRRFKQVRINLKKHHNIDVDFQEWHENYYTAYTYVTKFDSHFEKSENHPVLNNPPNTTKATSAKRVLTSLNENDESKSKREKPYKPPRLTSENVGDIIRDNNIKTPKQLYSFAKTQSKEGKNDLQAYLYKRPNSKQHADLISTVWNIEEAGFELEREKKSRLEILGEAKLKPCDIDIETGEECNGSWLASALETLSHNEITRKHFSELVLKNLVHGRGKGRNLMICGPTNCAKSFLLLPLTKIFKCFMTPSGGTYNWVEAPQKELIFLNDIRYEVDGEKRIMPWNMFLNLLEGVTVNISMPKNFYSKDFEWSERQPIFATADKPIMRIRNGTLDEGETQQMAQRWQIITFKHQYLGDKVNYNLVCCGSCFAKLILDES